MALLGMGGGNKAWVLKIVADIDEAVKGVETVGKETRSMKDKMVGIGKGVAAALGTAAVVEFGKQSITAASDAQQSFGAMESTFGDFTGQMEEFGKSSAENLGISNQEFNQMAATMGSLLKNTGMPMEQVADNTEVLTTRAADLAATFGTDVTQAVDAMSSAFKGEYDPLEAFGISLKASDVNARALAEGYVDASGEVTDAGKAIAAQEMILEQSADKAGTFAKESGTLAGQSQIMQARFKDLQATIGTALLPVMTKLMELLKPLMGFIQQNTSWLVPLTAAIGGLVLGVKAWNAAQLLLNHSLLSNPIFQVIAAVGALAAGIIWAYNNVGWFKDAVDAMAKGVVTAFNWVKDTAVTVFEWIKKNWPLLLAILTGPFGIAVGIIIKNWDTIKEAALKVFDWLKRNWPLLLAIITGPFGTAVYLIQRNWDTIKDAASRAVRAITGFVSNIWDIISRPFKRGAEMISDALHGIPDVMRWVVRQIENIVSGVKDVITYPFRQAFNGIRNLWNNTVGGFGFSVPSWIPGIGGKDFKIPYMATGGIVTGPTIAMIGEAGPEAVIPLSRAGGLALGNTVINVYALTANAEVGRKVYEALREYDRVNGHP